MTNLLLPLISILSITVITIIAIAKDIDVKTIISTAIAAIAGICYAYNKKTRGTK